jgi:predicted metallo-beta-lactamase superfamily hydrolase
MDGQVIASPHYYHHAQRVFEVVDRLRGKAQQLFDAANVLRKHQTDESLPFGERYRAAILIEEANELAKEHLDLADRLIRDH